MFVPLTLNIFPAIVMAASSILCLVAYVLCLRAEEEKHDEYATWCDNELVPDADLAVDPDSDASEDITAMLIDQRAFAIARRRRDTSDEDTSDEECTTVDACALCSVSPEYTSRWSCDSANSGRCSSDDLAFTAQSLDHSDLMQFDES